MNFRTNFYSLMCQSDFLLYADPSGQMLRICDQINQQNIHPDQQPAQASNLFAPTSSGSVSNIVQPHNPNPILQPTFQTAPSLQQQPFSSTFTHQCSMIFQCFTYSFAKRFYPNKNKFKFSVFSGSNFL